MNDFYGDPIKMQFACEPASQLSLFHGSNGWQRAATEWCMERGAVPECWEVGQRFRVFGLWHRVEWDEEAREWGITP